MEGHVFGEEGGSVGGEDEVGCLEGGHVGTEGWLEVGMLADVNIGQGYG